MTKFENVGMTLQLESYDVKEANQRFLYSCKLCSTRGMRIECSRCAIAWANAQVASTFEDAKEK